MASARRGKGGSNRKQASKQASKSQGQPPAKSAGSQVVLPIVDGRLPLVIHWTLSATNGWGIYGSQIALQLAGDRDLRPMICKSIPIEKLAFDALRNHRLRPVWADSAALHPRLAEFPKQAVRLNGAVLSALNDRMEGGWLGAGDTDLIGSPDVAVVFFVDTALDKAALDRAKRYDLVVAGSSWNRDLLEANGIGPVAYVLQGVDHTLFHPAPRSGAIGNRFRIFSGGKLEYRKGQDLILRAFAGFRTRHPEAQLVTAWHSPWPALARGLSLRGGVPKVPLDANGLPDIPKWAAAFGVPPEAITDLGPVPHAQMPTLLREMDVAVFPNRCEPGTNLVAMECMACAVPVVLSRNTGHLDIAFDDCVYPLTRQAKVAPLPEIARGTDGWGESDVDEIVEALETVWHDRAEAARRGLKGAERIAPLSWVNQIGKLKRTLLPLMRTAGKSPRKAS